MSLRRLLPLLGNRSVDLVRAGYLHPAFTVTRASAKSYIGADRVLRYAGSGAPAFDYRGLSIHAQSTNLLTYSEDQTNAVWNKVSSSVVADAYGGPDGLNTMDRITLSNLGTAETGRSVTGSAGAVYSMSIWMRPGAVGQIIRFRDGAGNSHIDCDLNAGSFVQSGSVVATTPSILMADGSRLYQFALTAASVVGFALRSQGGFPGDYGAWGAQIEAGYPSPYIGTTAATATRLPDNISASLSPLGLLSTGFTLVMRVLLPEIVNTRRLFSLNDGTGTGINSYLIQVSSPGNVRLHRFTGGVLASAAVAGAAVAGTGFTCAFAVNPAEGTATLAMDGGAVTSVAGGPSALSTLWLGQTPNQLENLLGFMPSLRALPYVATNAELQALSLAA